MDLTKACTALFGLLDPSLASHVIYQALDIGWAGSPREFKKLLRTTVGWDDYIDMIKGLDSDEKEEIMEKAFVKHTKITSAAKPSRSKFRVRSRKETRQLYNALDIGDQGHSFNSIWTATDKWRTNSTNAPVGSSTTQPSTALTAPQPVSVLQDSGHGRFDEVLRSSPPVLSGATEQLAHASEQSTQSRASTPTPTRPSEPRERTKTKTSGAAPRDSALKGDFRDIITGLGSSLVVNGPQTSNSNTSLATAQGPVSKEPVASQKRVRTRHKTRRRSRKARKSHELLERSALVSTPDPMPGPKPASAKPLIMNFSEPLQQAGTAVGAQVEDVNRDVAVLESGDEEIYDFGAVEEHSQLSNEAASQANEDGQVESLVSVDDDCNVLSVPSMLPASIGRTTLALKPVKHTVQQQREMAKSNAPQPKPLHEPLVANKKEIPELSDVERISISSGPPSSPETFPHSSDILMTAAEYLHSVPSSVFVPPGRVATRHTLAATTTIAGSQRSPVPLVQTVGPLPVRDPSFSASKSFTSISVIGNSTRKTPGQLQLREDFQKFLNYAHGRDVLDDGSDDESSSSSGSSDDTAMPAAENLFLRATQYSHPAEESDGEDSSSDSGDDTTNAAVVQDLQRTEQSDSINSLDTQSPYATEKAPHDRPVAPPRNTDALPSSASSVEVMDTHDETEVSQSPELEPADLEGPAAAERTALLNEFLDVAGIGEDFDDTSEDLGDVEASETAARSSPMDTAADETLADDELHVVEDVGQAAESPEKSAMTEEASSGDILLDDQNTDQAAEPTAGSAVIDEAFPEDLLQHTHEDLTLMDNEDDDAIMIRAQLNLDWTGDDDENSVGENLIQSSTRSSGSMDGVDEDVSKIAVKTNEAPVEDSDRESEDSQVVLSANAIADIEEPDVYRSLAPGASMQLAVNGDRQEQLPNLALEDQAVRSQILSEAGLIPLEGSATPDADVQNDSSSQSSRIIIRKTATGDYTAVSSDEAPPELTGDMEDDTQQDGVPVKSPDMPDASLSPSHWNVDMQVVKPQACVEVEAPTKKRKRVSTGKTSPHFATPSPAKKARGSAGTPIVRAPPLSAPRFGLIQEELATDPFRLLLVLTLLNKTAGKSAVPVFRQLVERYPTPAKLASADLMDVVKIVQCLGLHNRRAEKLVRLAKAWIADPPQIAVLHRTRNYPLKGDGNAMRPKDIIKEDVRDCAGALEIGHLYGCGPYAWDSWRIFCRDAFRGVAIGYNGEGAFELGFEPEWKRVLPLDKELRACLRWMWLREGWVWDPVTGQRQLASDQDMEAGIEPASGEIRARSRDATAMDEQYIREMDVLAEQLWSSDGPAILQEATAKELDGMVPPDPDPQDGPHPSLDADQDPTSAMDIEATVSDVGLHENSVHDEEEEQALAQPDISSHSARRRATMSRQKTPRQEPAQAPSYYSVWDVPITPPRTSRPSNTRQRSLRRVSVELRHRVEEEDLHEHHRHQHHFNSRQTHHRPAECPDSDEADAASLDDLEHRTRVPTKQQQLQQQQQQQQSLAYPYDSPRSFRSAPSPRHDRHAAVDWRDDEHVRVGEAADLGGAGLEAEDSDFNFDAADAVAARAEGDGQVRKGWVEEGGADADAGWGIGGSFRTDLVAFSERESSLEL